MSGLWESCLDVGYPVCGGAAYAVVVNKVSGLRKVGWDPALAAMAVSPLFVGSAFIAATPVVYRVIDRAAGIPNLATLVVYGLITCFGAAAQVLLVLWPTEEQARRAGQAGWRALWRLRTHLAVFALALAVMISVFFAALPHLRARETPTTFDTSFTTVPAVVVFLLVYQIAFAHTLAQLATLCHTLLADPAVAARSWHARGLRLIARGSSIALGYGAAKLAAIVIRVSGGHADVLSTIVAPQFASVGALFIAAGFSATVLGPRLVLWRRYRRIARLQREVTRVVPQTRMPRLWWETLLPPGWRHREWQRQVMELRDAQVLLAPYAAPAAVASAAAVARAEDLDPDAGRILAAAAVLRSGLLRYRAGHRPSSPDGSPVGPRAGRTVTGPDVNSEQHDLARLAAAYAGPVRALVPDTTDPAPDTHERLRRLVLVTHPTDLRIGLTLGLWRTFAVPAIAENLAAAGGLLTDPDRRAAATGEALFQLLEDGVDSPAGKPVLDQLRRIHAGVDPELMRYVLVVFALAPIRFIDRRGWRPTDDREKDDIVTFFATLGRALDVTPPDGGPPGWQRWVRDFEDRHFATTEQGRALWSRASGIAARRLPARIRPWAGPLAVAAAAGLLDPPVRAALGVARPGFLVRLLLTVGFRWRARRVRRQGR